jgi:hypothetical protein
VRPTKKHYKTEDDEEGGVDDDIDDDDDDGDDDSMVEFTLTCHEDTDGNYPAMKTQMGTIGIAVIFL